MLHVLVNDVSFGLSDLMVHKVVGDTGCQCRTPVPGIKPRFVLGRARAGMRFSLCVTSSKVENAAEM